MKRNEEFTKQRFIISYYPGLSTKESVSGLSEIRIGIFRKYIPYLYEDMDMMYIFIL